MTHAVARCGHAAVRFRALLDARWAAFFDEVKWRWDYQPCDFPGWSPQFLVQIPGYGPTLAEVKTAGSYKELSALVVCARGGALTLGSGPLGDGRVLGAYADQIGLRPLRTKTNLMPAWKSAVKQHAVSGSSRDTALVRELAYPWKRVVYARWLPIIGHDGAALWSEFVAGLAEEHAMFAVLNVADEIEFKDESAARATFRDRSIAGALLTTSLQQALISAAAKRGVRLMLSKLPDEAFE